ncbi:putative baseplate assembly protein [Candidatus Nitrotoga sp. M5]|uniref:putative baseplate assembly protein n=1 Tax=Candidatus Nitrotoga sp. M5 TaxID=2890409 RepID=UPI001EF636F9|nr:putative baseplate assembly protein [Candidatus Nitrotoga sp. M5]CAH1388066.1 putative baseplate assembly protein [Candidatus Nitrotoga sp. M5]
MSGEENTSQDACGCCAGVSAQSPARLYNRPGLTAIAYRIGTHSEVLASLQARLSSQKYPALAKLRTRDSDDFSIALLDAYACMADVLSFYQERLANESYLRTAGERLSLNELARLIGYRLKPGVAAETYLAFTLQEQPPQIVSNDPKQASGVPEKITLDIGIKVQSIPGPDEKPQIFETIERIEARPAWNAMPALTDMDYAPRNGMREIWLSGTSTRLKPGDVLIFAGLQFAANNSSNSWDARVLTEVESDDKHARTRVAWHLPLSSIEPADLATIYALRERASIFGYNAADWSTMSDEFKATYLGLTRPDQLTQEQRVQWPQFEIFAPDNSAGLNATAYITALEAAKVLSETMQASAQSMARESATAAGAIVGSAGALVQRITTLPVHLGSALLDMTNKLPEAVGQIFEGAMKPLRELVGTFTGNIESWAQETQTSMAGIIGLVSEPGLDLFDSTRLSELHLPAGPSLQSVNYDAIYTTGVSSLNDALTLAKSKTTGFSATLDGEIKAVSDATKQLWYSQRHLLETAIADSAAAAALARLMIELSLRPQLPYATVHSVCDAVDSAINEAQDFLPDFITAMALSDPRAAGLLLLLLADTEDVQSPEDLLGDSKQLAEQLALQLKETLPAGADTSHDPIVAGKALASIQLLTKFIDDHPGPIVKGIQRLHLAATRGVQRLTQTLTPQTLALREGRSARVLGGHSIDTISLEREFSGIVSGSYALLSKPDSIQLFHVSRVTHSSRTEFAISGKSTYLTLQGQNLTLFANAVRETTVLAASEELQRARAPLTTSVSGNEITVAASVDDLQAGRHVLVFGNRTDGAGDAVHLAILVSATPAAQAIDGGTLVITPPLPWSLKRDTVVVYGNVALATHGESVHQIIGSGAARLSHQRYTLKHTPLTFVGAENESGAESALEVRVNDIRWHETSTLYNAKADDRSYVLHVEEDGAGTIQFGDGHHGARLPTGQDNLRAVYRKGIGTSGNLQAGQLSQLLSRPLGLKAVSNPLPAAGGANADSATHARRNMPLGVRTLGRVVSVQDYEDYALAFTGIAKAKASVLNTRAGRTIFITVAGDDGIQPPDSTLVKLLNTLKQNGDPLVHCETKAYNEVTFRLALRIKYDPDHEREKVLADVDTALRAAFSFDARDFGQAVSRSEVIAVAQQVTGVLGVDLDRFYRGTAIALKSRLTPAAAMIDAQGNGIAAEVLLLDTGPLDYLEEMP